MLHTRLSPPQFHSTYRLEFHRLAFSQSLEISFYSLKSIFFSLSVLVLLCFSKSHELCEFTSWMNFRKTKKGAHRFFKTFHLSCHRLTIEYIFVGNRPGKGERLISLLLTRFFIFLSSWIHLIMPQIHISLTFTVWYILFCGDHTQMRECGGKFVIFSLSQWRKNSCMIFLSFIVFFFQRSLTCDFISSSLSHDDSRTHDSDAITFISWNDKERKGREGDDEYINSCQINNFTQSCCLSRISMRSTLYDLFRMKLN